MSQQDTNNNNNTTDDITENQDNLDKLNELMQTNTQLLDEKQRLQQEINFYRQRLFSKEDPINSA